MFIRNYKEGKGLKIFISKPYGCENLECFVYLFYQITINCPYVHEKLQRNHPIGRSLNFFIFELYGSENLGF